MSPSNGPLTGTRHQTTSLRWISDGLGLQDVVRLEVNSIWVGSDEDAVTFYDYHHSMVFDRRRSETFLRAIMKTVKPGDVVVDLGAGTGLLSLFAAAAGARRIYAIEHEPIGDIAREVATVNGVADRIEFVVGKSTEIDLPEKGDVLVTETIGNAAFDEGIIESVVDARKRHLKSDARIIPQNVSLICALLELPRDREDVEKLSQPVYTFDLSPLQSLMIDRMAWDELSPVSVVSDPRPIFEADLHNPITPIAGRKVLRARREAKVDAIGFWFSAVIAKGEILTNAPPNTTPSWNQGVTMLEKPFTIKKGDQINVQIDVSDDGKSFAVAVERR